jgi:hypothetical protein
VDAETRDGPPRALLIAAIVVAAGAILGILVFAALRQAPPEQRPVAIASVPAPKANTVECRTLLDAVPQQLPSRAPQPIRTYRCRGVAPDGEPVILRCGLDRPTEFVVGGPIQVVDAVQWFRVGEAGPAMNSCGSGPQHMVRGRPAGLCRVDIATGVGADTGPDHFRSDRKVVAAADRPGLVR